MTSTRRHLFDDIASECHQLECVAFVAVRS